LTPQVRHNVWCCVVVRIHVIGQRLGPLRVLVYAVARACGRAQLHCPRRTAYPYSHPPRHLRAQSPRAGRAPSSPHWHPLAPTHPKTFLPPHCAPSDAPTVTWVNDGPGGNDVSAQPITWLMTANWANRSATPASLAVVRLQVINGDGSGTTLLSQIVANATSESMRNLSMVPGSAYRSCVQPVNSAGVAGSFVCSDGVDVGKTTLPVPRDRPSTVLLSPFPASAFTSSDNSTNDR
jgi:hypothetical protein